MARRVLDLLTSLSAVVDRIGVLSAEILLAHTVKEARARQALNARQHGAGRGPSQSSWEIRRREL